MLAKPPIRIGNVSGATGDHPDAMARMVADGTVDVITGDWLSEMNIAWNAIKKQEDPESGFEDGFYTQLEQNLDDIVAKNIKVITNAGALNTLALTRKVRQLCDSRSHQNVVVAAVLGDDVSSRVCDREKRHKLGLKLPHLDHSESILYDWALEPISANAYIGCQGIIKALQSGADIVICGRCTDASPVMGAAAWWFNWREEQYHELAGSLVAAHLIECGPYVVGANFSGFKGFLSDLVDFAFPIAEISSEGHAVITRAASGGGHVTKETVTAQLLYELQGHLYLNPDVVGDLSEIRVENEGREQDRVRVYGAKGMAPPSSTKVMVAAPGGYQAEATFFINGLDVQSKAQMMKKQLEYTFRENNFSKFSVELYGSQVEDPTSQQAGTVQLRVFAQARRKEDIDASKFKIPIYALRMQSYPGYHMNLDFRTMDPKPFMEIFPALMPQDAIQQQVMLRSDCTISVPPPKYTEEYAVLRPSYETAEAADLSTFGPTERAPLGSIVHARSGDKADNSNIGFFVRQGDEYPWLRAFLTVERLKWLFGEDWSKCNPNRRVERVEFAHLHAVHL